MPNIAGALRRSLSPHRLDQLKAAAAACEARGFFLFLVGGSVRDIMLDRRPADLDLSAVGGDEELFNAVADALEGETASRSQFGTARIEPPGGAIDLALARRETYASPGALPTVSRGTLRDDLARRDFSINAMAVSLGTADWGELEDPHGGLGDIGDRLVRVLHPASFVDDATRILRAVRYAVRLGFAIEAETEAMLRRDLGYLDKIGGARVGSELDRLLAEPKAIEMLAAAQGLGVLAAVYPPLGVPDNLGEMSAAAEAVPEGERAAALLSFLAFHLPPGTEDGLAQRLKLDGRSVRVVEETGKIRDEVRWLGGKAVPPSVIHRFLRDFSESALLGAMLAIDSPIVSERLDLFHSDLRHRRTALDGEDLKRLGVPEGPEIGRLLEMLMAAKLDGMAETREDELRLVRRALGTGGEQSSTEGE